MSRVGADDIPATWRKAVGARARSMMAVAEVAYAGRRAGSSRNHRYRRILPMVLSFINSLLPISAAESPSAGSVFMDAVAGISEPTVRKRLYDPQLRLYRERYSASFPSAEDISPAMERIRSCGARTTLRLSSA